MAGEHPDKGPLAILNGEEIPFREARLPVYDLGVMQGATLTERLRTVRHQPYLVLEHLTRLLESLTSLSWAIPFDQDTLAKMVQRLAQANTVSLPPHLDLSIVLFVTAGQGLGDANGEITSSRPTLCLYTAPLPFRRWSAAYQEGVPLIVPRIRQSSARSLDPRIKHRSRLHWALADQQAHEMDPHSQALLLDEHGAVTETSSGNLFVVRNGTLLTPEAESTLPGISQAKVIQLAQQKGLQVERARLAPNDVATAEEAFLTSSTYCLLPVSRIDGRPIGTGRPGNITRELTETWCQEIGLNFPQQAIEGATQQPET